MRLGACIHVHLACDSGETPEVLVLKVRTVAPSHHLHCHQCLLPWYDILGKVKFCFHLRVFAIANLLTVHPQGKVACGGAYVHVYLLACPFLGDDELPAVGTRIVVPLFHIGRIVGELCCPGIAHVLVYAVAIAIDFEKPWYGECRP